jgi:hypothetical protein
MKKKLLCVIGLVGLITIACQKAGVKPSIENADKVETASSAQPQSNNLASRTAPSKYRIFYNGPNPYCDNTNGNCLDDVIVNLTYQSVLDTVATGIASDIVSCFNHNYTALDVVLITSDLNNVISGSLSASVQNSSNGNQFLILKNSSNVITRVYPFVQ